MTVLTTLHHSPSAHPSQGQALRDEIDALHSEFLDTARRVAQLAEQLDHDDAHAAGGRARAAVGHLWRGAEDLHAAFHRAPPRAAGPSAPVARLCARRMRYLAARTARKAA
ncbi:DUF6238 family protein [Streptomyces sp. NPDC057654]|uniref:DUF6238 family protein n=1 Tax=Streptomyces sp. NPDC057654 TaxID=3346196 RepID=UPI0036B14F7B